ncbi:MAG: nucleotide exchange factor GrpE [Phycisphaerales bacterium]|nr:nucleotide exchange factor GrpE [Phycisphaerales bacterium]
MSKGKKKIVIPSEDEVAQFGGEAEGAAADAEATSTSSDQPASAADEGTKATPPQLAELEEWKEKCLRAKAELLNYQKRTQKEHQEALRYAHASLVRALLPILDDLERVVASGLEHQDNAESILDGVKMTLGNCKKVLGEHQVVPIEAQGQAFDPQIHEAMMQQPSDDYPVPTVLQELVKGYKLHERVLRPARVIVSRPSETGEAQADSNA